jgi:hypothetical protein
MLKALVDARPPAHSHAGGRSEHLSNRPDPRWRVDHLWTTREHPTDQSEYRWGVDDVRVERSDLSDRPECWRWFRDVWQWQYSTDDP